MSADGLPPPAVGRVGIWTFALDDQPAAIARGGAAALEDLGFDVLWIPEGSRREIFANAAILLDASTRLVLATGIANIHARDAVTMSAGQMTLGEAFPNRFILGLGVGHKSSVEGVRGHEYGRPLARMEQYLDEMAAADYEGVVPTTGTVTILAALGPRMLELARRRSSGAHPYHGTAEHTRRARTILGEDRWLAPELPVVFETDPVLARGIARARFAKTLAQPNYLANFRRLGFVDDDFGNGGSDQLIDAVVAWGDRDAIVARIAEHLAAGADHVAVQVFTATPMVLPISEWRTLAQGVREAAL